MTKVHRGEAKYTSMTDLQWTSTETKSSQKLNNSPFHNFTANAYNHDQTINDQTSQNHFFPCYITGNQSPKCTLPHPCEVYRYEGSRPLRPDYSEKPLSTSKPIFTDPRTRLPADWLLCQPTRSQAENTCQSTGTSCQQHTNEIDNWHSKECTLYRTGVTRWRV